MLRGIWVNGTDGPIPSCPCGHVFQDGDTGDVKNYPDDGLVAVFFNCPKCNKESSHYYKPFLEL